MTLPHPQPSPDTVRLSDLLAALSFALDLTEGQPMGHALRTTLISGEIARRLGVPLAEHRDAHYAALLKDVGCSSNAAAIFALFGGDDRLAKGRRMQVDWSNYFRAALYMLAETAPGASWFTRARRITELARRGPGVAVELVRTRCERGGELVERLALGAGVATAVRALDEHWDGRGQPRALRGEEIPLAARIVGLAQTLEVFAMRRGAPHALEVVRARSGRWFDPVVVAACSGIEPQVAYWCALDTRGLLAAVRDAEPGGASLLAGPARVDNVARVFAEIVDAKSPFTGAHSQRTSELAARVAHRLGHDARDIAEARRASLLHDIGKLTVPNTILDKPGPLTVNEWEVMRMHSLYTERILEHVGGFEWLAFAAASHHERLDGSGYCRGLRGSQVSTLSRVIAVADIYDALSTARPYRPALKVEQAFALMETDRGTGLCPECLDAIEDVVLSEMPDDRVA